MKPATHVLFCCSLHLSLHPTCALLLRICTQRGRLYCCSPLHLICCFFIAPAPFFRAAAAAICGNDGLPICLCMHAPPLHNPYRLS